MDQLTLRWYGHACFTVTCREFTVAFDPYEDNYVSWFCSTAFTGRLGTLFSPA